MRRLGSVQQKIPCVFLTEVKEEHSRKRDCQDSLTSGLDSTGNPTSRPRRGSESISTLTGAVKVSRGTSIAILRRCQRRGSQPTESDITVAVQCLMNMDTFQVLKFHRYSSQVVIWSLLICSGWVPVEKDNKQYCWHSSVVDDGVGAALVLRPSSDDEDMLEIAAVPLADLLEQTLELIGTNVNGNPYGLGSKKQPVHCLVSHGSIGIRNPPPVDFQQLCSWFQESPEGRVEGIVWHCNDGTLIKVHRHHLGLRWPDGDTCLGDKSVVIHVDEYNSSQDLFTSFSRLNGHRFSRLPDINFDL
ncbi:hypothetical protein FQN60_014294 [Etheostoma spectabile]|uniref:RNA ligase 1 n=1 Tax=Etheostoma spectabile TaxID=54343 RepID=A0A5J5DBL0_9PERO|nr:hypothetical protein FQN60_014294 [Etheostoma spectabile]